MRTILNFLTLSSVSLFAFSAMACPDFTGHYSWTSSSRKNPVTWNLTVTQNGCDSVTYVSVRDDNSNAIIRDEKVADGKCFEYKEHEESPRVSCYLYRFDGDALIGETFDKDDANMPWVQATTLRITKAASGNLHEAYFEGTTATTPFAEWEYTVK